MLLRRLLVAALALLTPLAAQVCGDCDQDGAITILDALTAARDAVGLQPVPPGTFGRCDADRSGAITVLDALLMAAHCVGSPVVLACSLIDLDVDTNRDSWVSNDPDDDDDEDRWSSSTGAVFLFNCDDDDGDGDRDHLDSEVNGPADAEDLTRIIIRGMTAPPGASARLQVLTAAGATCVRIFRLVPPGTWVQIHDPAAPAEYDFPASDLDGGDVTLGIEAVSSRVPGWDGFLELQLRVLHGLVELGEDRVLLRSSPVILPDNTRGAVRVHAVDINNPGEYPNAPFLAAFESTLSAAGISWLWADGSVVLSDRWMQDCMQAGFQRRPGPGSATEPWTHVHANRPGWGLFDYLPLHLLTEELGMVNPGATFTSSLNGGGNLEVVPPHQSGSSDFPLGRVAVGGGSGPPVRGGPLITAHMDPAHREWLDAQEVQAPHLEVSTEWLAVGHLDEIVMFAPSLIGGRPWKLLMASPDLAVAELLSLQASGKGGLTVFAGRPGWETTVDDILGNTTLMAFNAAVQARLDLIRIFLKAQLDLTEADIVDLPGLYEPYHMLGAEYAVGYNPGAINMQVVGTYLFIADPEGPHDGGVDVWQQRTADELHARLGAVHLTWVDCFTSYHELMGEVHCGSNVERTPQVPSWWEY